MIRSLLISIRVKDELVDFYLQAAFNVLSELVRQEVVAKTNTAIMHRDNVVEVAGVLCFFHPSWDLFKSRLMTRALLGTGLTRRDLAVRTMPAVGYDGNSYCGLRVREDLELVCDPLSGMPPLRTAAEGDYVAAHRLSLADRTRTDLWTWDENYQCVFSLWAKGGPYEAWAARELSGPGSAINKRGRSVARRITRETGLRVDYPLHDAATR